ncbi:MAG: histidine kinase, partial [Bacteroidia bacterium]|nr:histidine kinase [Bacteroidia bacterium]
IVNGGAEIVVSDIDLKYSNIRAIRSRDSLVWMATSSGLVRYNQNSGELMTLVEDELRSNNLYLLEFDLQGSLYVGHEQGLEKLKVNETGDVIEVDFYGVAEGFLGIETCQNASFCDRQGNVWFGTINGLTQYNPNVLEVNTTPPKIWLDNIDLFYERLRTGRFEYEPVAWNELRSRPIFPYDQNHLSFSFVGIDLNSPTKIMYQWKLQGFDDDWIRPTSKQDAIYSNLPPGDYTLMYRSISVQGVESEVGEWAFSIHAPFWQMWWFKLLKWLVPFLIVATIILLYIRRIKLKGRREREKLILEKELIELEQKALRLQMNPHFLFNALNSIQSLVALENHQDARKYLQKFAKLMRLTLQNSRVESITLSDEIITLRNYMELEQLTRKPAFDFAISHGEDVNPENLYIPPMMLQPFIENSIKHGLPDLGDKGRIELRFEQHGDKLVCSITDNGIGRKAAEQRAKDKSKSHESAAIQVITDRLNILNQEHPGNTLAIHDLEEGTAVVITLAVG